MRECFSFLGGCTPVIFRVNPHGKCLVMEVCICTCLQEIQRCMWLSPSHLAALLWLDGRVQTACPLSWHLDVGVVLVAGRNKHDALFYFETAS